MKEIIVQIPDNCEVQIVRKEKNKEQVIKTYQDLIDNRISSRGYYIDSFSELRSVNDGNFDSYHDRNIATSKKVAKSMLAMAMISQLMPYYGGEISDEEWLDNNIDKFTIERAKNKISTYSYNKIYHFLSFHTKEQRDEFIKYNEQLVKDYLMIE